MNETRCQEVIFEPPFFVTTHPCPNKGKFTVINDKAERRELCGVHRNEVLRWPGSGWRGEESA